MKYIRQAKQEDLVRIAEIEIFNYRLNFYPIFQSDWFYFEELQVPKRMKEYEDIVNNIWVYDDGVIKGFICVEGQEVKKLFVEPVLQGQSFGAALLEYAVAEMDVRFLWALEKNVRGIEFYKRHGFYVTDDRKTEEGTAEYLVRLERLVRVVRTERLYLRNLRLSDVDTMHDYRNNESCNKYQHWEAFSREDIQAFVLKFQGDEFLSTKKEQHFAICSKEEDVLVGELAYFYTEGDCITLGISISYQYHRKGFSFEILTEVIRQIQIKYPKMDIVGLIEKENVKSIGLFEKLGFEQECFAESVGSYVYVIYGK